MLGGLLVEVKRYLTSVELRYREARTCGCGPTQQFTLYFSASFGLYDEGKEGVHSTAKQWEFVDLTVSSEIKGQIVERRGNWPRGETTAEGEQWVARRGEGRKLRAPFVPSPVHPGPAAEPFHSQVRKVRSPNILKRNVKWGRQNWGYNHFSSE